MTMTTTLATVTPPSAPTPVVFVSLTPLQRRWVSAASEVYPNTTLFTMPMVREVCTRTGLNLPQWFVNDRRYREARGLYRLPRITDRVAVEATTATPAKPVEDGKPSGTMQPSVDPTFVSYGVYGDVERIVGSRRFHSMWINGLQGMGKSFLIEQACARHGREYVFVQFTSETSEDDLLGGYRLIDGNTVWVDGPILVAMKRGAVLNLDEADRATNRILGIQRALEGQPIFVKKTNTWVAPAEGFTVFATANTKGQGDETGKFIGTNVLNAAFLDRFYESVTHEYPPEAVEVEVLNRVAATYSLTDHGTFVTALVRWANHTRKNFAIGTCTEVISTRRLIQAVRCYAMYGDRLKAVTRILNRFDDATVADFTAAYRLHDAEATEEAKRATELAKSLAQVPSDDQVKPDPDPIPAATATASAAAPTVKPKRKYTRKPKLGVTASPAVLTVVAGASTTSAAAPTANPDPTKPVPVCPF